MDWDMLPNGDMRHSNEIGIEKMPAPTAGIFDSPVSCGVGINSEWLSFIIARLEILTDTRAWLGTSEETITAARQIELLLEALADSDGCLYPQPEILNPLTSTTVQINIPDDPVYADVFFEKMAELATPGIWQGSEETTQLISDVWAEVLDTAEQNFGSGEAVMPASFRVNDGMIEYQPYGGAGWEILGDACPCPPTSVSPVYNPDVVDPDALACAIAVNLVEYLFAKADDMVAAFTAELSVAGAMDSIFLIFGNVPGYVFVDGALDLAQEVVGATLSVWTAWLTVEHKEQSQEWWYCRLKDESPPNVTEEIWQEFKDWHAGEHGGGLGGIFQHKAYNSMEYMLINDRARIASYDSGNCVAFSCAGWEKVFDFTVDSNVTLGWVDVYSLTGYFTWIPGTGLRANRVAITDGWRKVLRQQHTLPAAAAVTAVKIEYTLTGTGATNSIVRSYLGATQQQQASIPSSPGTVEITPLTTDRIWYNLEKSDADSGNIDAATVIVSKITIYGIGDDPYA